MPNVCCIPTSEHYYNRYPYNIHSIYNMFNIPPTPPHVLIRIASLPNPKPAHFVFVTNTITDPHSLMPNPRCTSRT